MKNKIMVVGFALVSVLVVAQSNNTDPAKKTNTDTKQSTDAKTDRTKSAMAKAEAEAESAAKAREASSGMATGKKTAEAPNSDPKVVKVATGDVNGDGKAAPATQEVKAPRDAATGQASGKRQHN